MPCTEFDKFCRSWPHFDEKKFSLSIRYTKIWNLPDDVYDDGEKRPVRHKRKRESFKSESANKRQRTITTSVPAGAATKTEA